MHESIKLTIRSGATRPMLSLVGLLLVALTSTLPARAHAPGLDEIDRITAQLAEGGEQAELYAKRARIFQNNHMWQEAMSDFDRAAEIDSQNVKFDLERAGLSFEAGAYLRALDFIELYLLRHEVSTEAALIQARSYRELGQYRRSIESYQTALTNLATFDGSPLPEWYVEFANTLLLAGDKRQALQVLQQGMDQLGEPGVFRLQAIALEVDLGLFDSALARIDRLLLQAQRKDLWLARRADILSRAGREDEARQGYQQAFAALKQLPLRIQNLPVSRELENRLQEQLARQ